MSWKGFYGPRPFTGMQYIDDIIKEIQEIFNVSKEDVLFGYGCTPPIDIPYDVYVKLDNASVEYFFKHSNKWVNWNWEE